MRLAAARRDARAPPELATAIARPAPPSIARQQVLTCCQGLSSRPILTNTDETPKFGMTGASVLR